MHAARLTRFTACSYFLVSIRLHNISIAHCGKTKVVDNTLLSMHHRLIFHCLHYYCNHILALVLDTTKGISYRVRQIRETTLFYGL